MSLFKTPRQRSLWDGERFYHGRSVKIVPALVVTLNQLLSSHVKRMKANLGHKRGVKARRLGIA